MKILINIHSEYWWRVDEAIVGWVEEDDGRVSHFLLPKKKENQFHRSMEIYSGDEISINSSVNGIKITVREQRWAWIVHSRLEAISHDVLRAHQRNVSFDGFRMLKKHEKEVNK